MARVTYLGLSDPVASFKLLAPYRQGLCDMKLKYRPSSPEFSALSHAIMTLDVAANLITGHLQFFDVGYGDTGRVGQGARRD